MSRFQKTLLAAGVLVAVGANIALHKAGATPAFLRAASLHDTAYAKGDSSNAKAAARFPAGKPDRFGRAMKMLSTLKRISVECERQKTTVFDSVTIAKKWIDGFRLAKEELAAHLKAHPNDARAKAELAKVQWMLDGIPDALVSVGLRQIGVVEADSTGMTIMQMYDQPVGNGLALIELAHELWPDDAKIGWWRLRVCGDDVAPSKMVDMATRLLGKPHVHGHERQFIDVLMDRGDAYLYMKRACAYSRMRKPYRALSDLNKAIALAPKYFEAYRVKFAIINNSLGMRHAADGVVEDYMKAIGKPVWEKSGLWRTQEYYDVLKRFMGQ